jgi:prophage antirepressor-like protein
MNATTTPAVFQFNTHQVRTVVKDGEPWFIASDVCATLGYRDAATGARCLDDDEKGTHNVCTLGGEQKLTVISESGLYALVLRSRKPEARKFAKWVTSEVLPAIRKTGKFDAKTATGPLTEEMRNIIKSMVMERAKALPLTEQANAIIKAWSALKAHFGVSYKEIPSDQFAEALSLVARMQVEWELAEPEILPSPSGRYRRELVIVDASGTRVIDATSCSLIDNDRVHALRRDFKVMQTAMVEMSSRMRVCLGEYNASDLDVPLAVKLL